MNYKEFTLIPTQKSGFVQLEIEDWARQNKKNRHESKVISRSSIDRKFSLGATFICVGGSLKLDF